MKSMLHFQPHQVLHSGPRHAAQCVVCGAALHPAQGAAAQPVAYPTCHAVACRMVVGRRAEMGETGFRHYLRRQVQEKQRQTAHAQASEARRLIESEENAKAWAALHAYARLPAELAAEPMRLLLPSGPRRSRMLPAARRDRYRAHLTDIVHRAAAMAPGDPAAAASADTHADAPSTVSSMPGRLCALCGGGCCTRGTEHAYLSAATVRRFMDSQPQLSPEQVIAAYLDRLTSVTQAGSCINHTRAGCSLPREMRSDICNRYACASLAKLQVAHGGVAGTVHPVLVVRRKLDQWHRDDCGLDNAVNGTALLRETGVRHMPRG